MTKQLMITAAAAALLLLSRLAPRLAWPVRAFERAWIGIAPLPLAGFLALYVALLIVMKKMAAVVPLPRFLSSDARGAR